MHLFSHDLFSLFTSVLFSCLVSDADLLLVTVVAFSGAKVRNCLLMVTRHYVALVSRNDSTRSSRIVEDEHPL